ncbi:hypothetical protein [Dyella lutea]|uniref:Uncharacterized protein n=1 Tax=Dyella lutea TaxID=2950441 RepID=A0ABT1FDA1_9GAMM|nr:hypothetical protein [Dyella lutea]MCP1375352.1 hypothetical protein [Dyella lutea]
MGGIRSRTSGGHTGDLFAIPVPASPLPGSMDYRAVVAHLVASMIAESGLTRYAIAAQVSELVNKDVSKYMLDAYTAESRDEFNAPAWLLPVIETVCKSHLYSNWLAEIRGGRLLIGRDALAAELGRIERQRDELGTQARTIKEQLRKVR